MDIAVNALAAQIERTASATPADAPVALPAAAPDELAAARFAATMQSPAVEPLAAAQSAAVPPAVSDTLSNSLGDRMLASLQGASQDFKSVWRETETRLKSDQALQMQEMMAMQLQVTQMAVEFDLIGKIVSRSTQNLDQLVRVQ